MAKTHKTDATSGPQLSEMGCSREDTSDKHRWIDVVIFPSQ